MQQCDVCRREVHRDVWLAHLSGKKHRKQEEKRAKGVRPEEEAQAQPRKRPRDDGERRAQEVTTREAAALVAAALVAATQTEQEAQAKKRPCDEERGDVRCLGVGHGL